jgi:hypothetical protein
MLASGLHDRPASLSWLTPVSPGDRQPKIVIRLYPTPRLDTEEFVMKTDRELYSKFAAIALIIAIGAAACAPGELQVYEPGDVVDVGFDQHWALSSVEFRGDILEAGFTIENVGTENTAYNLVLSLQARNPAGNPLPQVIPCGSNLDGALQPGGQITGVICWNTRGAQTIRIHYIILLADSNIVWEVER